MSFIEGIVFDPLAAAVVLWLLIANGYAYLLFAVDKRRALRGEWRISEAVLLASAVAGGWIGAKLAQRRLRHKTRKQPFGNLLNLMAVPLALLLMLGAVNQQAGRALAEQVVAGAEALWRAEPLQGFAEEKGPSLPRRFGPGS